MARRTPKHDVPGSGKVKNGTALPAVKSVPVVDPGGRPPVKEVRTSTPHPGTKAGAPSTFKRCEECGEELADRRVRVRGHIMTIVHCPRCTPDPLRVLQE